MKDYTAKSAARVIFNFAKDAVEVLTRAKWDTLRTFYKQSILKLTYKMYHNDLPSCMTAHFVKSQPSYNLRNSLKLEIPPFKSNIKKYSISYRGGIICQSSVVTRIVWKCSPGWLTRSLSVSDKASGIIYQVNTGKVPRHNWEPSPSLWSIFETNNLCFCFFISSSDFCLIF